VLNVFHFWGQQGSGRRPNLGARAKVYPVLFNFSVDQKTRVILLLTQGQNNNSCSITIDADLELGLLALMN